ncbi:MAG: signal peptidase I, partial [bacterium]|nr:signal peptidase I [bacterium]
GPPRAMPEPRRRARSDRADVELFDEEADEGDGDFGEDLEEARAPWRTAAGWVVTVALAVVLSLLIRSFVAHAFHVESGSMEPTLAPGDRILVNKLSDNPSRGDLVVFNRPDGDLVKRVVALEGETVDFDEGIVKIGDMWLREPYLAAGVGTYVRSAIPNCDPDAAADAGACTVPEGHVFVLGDNRDVSFDSRNFGPVPRADLVGNAAFQFWPLGDMRGF